MSGGIIYRHHEVHRSKLYLPAPSAPSSSTLLSSLLPTPPPPPPLPPPHPTHTHTHAPPQEETLPAPIKHVDVMRQTRTSMDNASEHTLNDRWNEESDVALSEDSVRSTRFQILRIPEKVQTGKLSTHKCAHDHTTRHHLARGMAQIVKETQEELENTENEMTGLQEARWQRR